MLTRRQLLATPAAAVYAQTRRTPNVLVFMSDQESALLPGPAKLPNRERLFRRATRYTHAFCNTPQCSPARAALLTGLDPHKAGVLTNVDTGSLGRALNPELPNAGSAFRKAGYATGYFGKWHLGNDPLDRFGFAHNLTRGKDEEFVRAAADWIRKQKSPWMAWVSVLDPHHIYDAPRALSRVKARHGVGAPETDAANLKGKPREQQWFLDEDQGRAVRGWTAEDWLKYRSFYLELVEKVDAMFGRLLDGVDLDNTIVVYTSDHGDALGEHGLPFKGPFMYEPLIRIPLIMAVPGRAPGRSDRLTTQADLAGLVTSAAGVKWDGPSPKTNPEEVFLEYYAKQKQVNPIRTVRTREWKLNVYDSGASELYHLKDDPHEKTNLTGETGYATVKSHLQAKLDAWRGPLKTK